MSRSVQFLSTTILATLLWLPKSSAQPDYPLAQWVPPTCSKWYTTGNGHSLIVIHDMEGYYESAISYLNRCDQDTNGNYNVSASVHFLANGQRNGSDEDGHSENDTTDAPAGDITQSIRESNYAWHAVCLNKWSFGTEHEGFVSSPAWYTEEMYRASAALQRYLCDKYGIIKDRNHIVGHGEWQNAAWVAWMSTNYPSIDPFCNNHTDPGQYWNWSHFMDLISNTPPVINQPWSVVADRGSNVTFKVTAKGVTPLSYQWRKAGTNLAGATLSAYTLANVQTTNAGGFSVVVTNVNGAVTSRVATLSVNPVWVQAFTDNFDINRATNWNLFWGAGNGIADFTTNWAFDYSTSKYVAYGITNSIPSAPNAGGTKIGLKVTVNKSDATAATAAVSLHPKNLVFSNSYSLRFDAWINYNGAIGGGSGSTEYLTAGLNHAGTRVNWNTTASSSDGLWFAVDGEGGSGGSDYQAFLGNGAAAPTQLTFANSGLASSGAAAPYVTDPFFQFLLPSPTYETGGVPGKHWVQVEVNQVGNVISWQLNGVVVAQRTNTSSFTSGDVMIGYMDPFTSIANPAADNFLILDNVRVLIGAVPPTIAVQPQTQTLKVTSNVTFSVTAGGIPAPGYQWRYNGTNIAAATASRYTRLNLTTNDAGNYSVAVTNVGGSVTSSNALLTVNLPVPLIFANATLLTGNQLSFSVSGEPGVSVTIWRSDDLTNWVILTNLPNPTGTLPFTDPILPEMPRRFYRAQLSQ